MEFLPKDLLYNEITYDNSSRKLLESLEILEKANNQKSNENEKRFQIKEPEEPSFWTKLGDFLNPFKCADYGTSNNKN